MPYGQPFYNYAGNTYTPMQAPNYNMYAQQPQMPTMPQNQPLNGFQGQQQMQQPQTAVIPPKTNVPLATSLIDAMSRNAEFNTDTFYADQDKPYIYRVSIDMQGRKTYRTFELKDVTEQVVEQGNQPIAQNLDLSDYATKEDLQKFRDEIMGYAMTYLNANNQPSTAQSTVSEPKSKKTVVKESENKE